MEGDKSIVARQDKSLERKAKNYLKSIGKPILDLVIGLFTENIPSSIKAGMDIIEGIKVEGDDSVEHRAFVLLYNAMRRTIVQLVWDNHEVIQKGEAATLPLDQLRMMSEELEEALMEMEIELDQYFFNHPENLSFLPLLQHRFESWLSDLKVDPKIAGNMARKLRLQFCLELEDLYGEKEAYFTPVREKVKEKLPISMARAKYAYNEKLIAEWEKPIFDEPFGLDKLYIQLNACYPWPIKDEKGKQFTHKIVASEEHILAWLQEENPEQKIFILRGGPGSGKSSLMKKIVREVALQGSRPVYAFQLQHFKIKEDLESAIKDYFYRMEEVLREVPDILGKDNEAKEKSPLLVFDGLDELSRSGENGEELARQFSINLSTFLGERRTWTDWDIRVIITGRDFVIQKISEPVFGRKSKVLELLPYSIGKNSGRLLKLDECFLDENGLTKIDQRGSWWKGFWDAKGKTRKGIPAAVKKGEYTDLSRQPLLSYLLARVYVDGRLDESEEANINSVYEELIDSLRIRAWGGDGGYKHSTYEDKERFFRLMEEMAISAWHHGDVRVTNLKHLEIRCKQQKLESQIEEFKLNTKNSVNSLVVSFFAKLHKADTEGGDLIEFTHKSFGEYLVARRLVRLAKEVAETLHSRHKRRIENAMSDWLETCSDALLRLEIWGFIVKEVQFRPSLFDAEGKILLLDASQVQSDLAELYSILINDGFKPDGLENNLAILNKTIFAEINLFMIISAFARVSEQPTRIQWKNAKHSRRVVGWVYFLPERYFIWKGFHRLVFPESADLSNSNLRNADLRNADLRYADLRHADLTYADLSYADLSNANLSNADLSNANLTHSNLHLADLSGANISSADFRGAHVNSINLTGANLNYDGIYHPIIDAGRVLNGQMSYDYFTQHGAINVPLPPKRKYRRRLNLPF